jgi:hypothetical protein
MKFDIRAPNLSPVSRFRLQEAVASGRLWEIDDLLTLELHAPGLTDGSALPITGLSTFIPLVNDAIMNLNDNGAGVFVLDYDDSLRIEYKASQESDYLILFRSDVELGHWDLESGSFYKILIDLRERAFQIVKDYDLTLDDLEIELP